MSRLIRDDSAGDNIYIYIYNLYLDGDGFDGIGTHSVQVIVVDTCLDEQTVADVLFHDISRKNEVVIAAIHLSSSNRTSRVLWQNSGDKTCTIRLNSHVL